MTSPFLFVLFCIKRQKRESYHYFHLNLSFNFPCFFLFVYCDLWKKEIIFPLASCIIFVHGVLFKIKKKQYGKYLDVTFKNVNDMCRRQMKALQEFFVQFPHYNLVVLKQTLRKKNLDTAFIYREWKLLFCTLINSIS